MSYKNRRSILIFIFLVVIIASILTFWYAYPKTMIHPNYNLMMPGYVSTTSDRFLLYYRGFDLQDFPPGIFSRQFYKFRMIAEYDIVFLYDVSRRDPGYIGYKAYYPDGTLNQIGQCYMDFTGGGQNIPMPDDTNILSVTCYRPDGSVAGEVINGTGIHTYWYPDGKISNENTYHDGIRIQYKFWYQNGQLASIQNYQDGSYTRYDKQGNKVADGKYKNGFKIGTWTYYNPDGSVQKFENLNDPNQNPVGYNGGL